MGKGELKRRRDLSVAHGECGKAMRPHWRPSTQQKPCLLIRKAASIWGTGTKGPPGAYTLDMPQLQPDPTVPVEKCSHLT